MLLTILLGDSGHHEKGQKKTTRVCITSIYKIVFSCTTIWDIVVSLKHIKLDVFNNKGLRVSYHLELVTYMGPSPNCILNCPIICSWSFPSNENILGMHIKCNDGGHVLWQSTLSIVITDLIFKSNPYKDICPCIGPTQSYKHTRHALKHSIWFYLMPLQIVKNG